MSSSAARVVFLLASAALAGAGAGRSPNAHLVDRLLQTTDLAQHYSSNIIEDAFLDAEGLARKYGYPFEEHAVTTEDGYVLGVHRIPRGRDAPAARARRPRPAVLLMHGLLSSSADYLIMGPGSALGYILADEGYDVWLGNARGNYYSRRHVSLDPNDRRSVFWDFSWDEIGNKDLPAMVDYILAHTGHSALHYVGMSQGTTSFFVMGSLRPDYSSKIISMQALAPVAYLAHNEQIYFTVLSRYVNTIEALFSMIGIKEVLPNNAAMTLLGLAFCSDRSPVQPLCSALLFEIGGFNPSQHNATMLPAKIGHAPAGCAFRQVVHYGQSIHGKAFRRYDHGALGNLRAYGSPTPPEYPLGQVTAPVYLHYSQRDPLAPVADVLRLHAELGGPKALVPVPQPTFSHIDFMWGIDAKSLVFDTMIRIMKAHDNDTQLPADSRN